MIFYFQPKGQELLEYVAKRGKFIGTLNINDPNTRQIQKEDISLQQIKSHLLINQVLLPIIFNLNWEISFIAINAESFQYIKQKFKKARMLWYWINVKDTQRGLSPNKFEQVQLTINEIIKG